MSEMIYSQDTPVAVKLVSKITEVGRGAHIFQLPFMLLGLRSCNLRLDNYLSIDLREGRIQ